MILLFLLYSGLNMFSVLCLQDSLIKLAYFHKCIVNKLVCNSDDKTDLHSPRLKTQHLAHEIKCL